MYITYNETNYPCKCSIGATMVYSDLPAEFPAPVSGDVVLCADDGFVMRTDNTEDYARQSFSDGVLILTNTPEPIPEPEPEAEPTVWDELDAAYLEGVNHAYE